jgi:hypothetical protein
MTDLAAQIRAKLDAIGEGDDDCRMQCGRSCAEDGYDDVVAAVLVVLDLHPTEAHECPDRDDYEPYTAYEPTCPTLRAIAEKLGIEVDDG